MTFSLGKKPARKGAVKFKLSKYVDASALPKTPRHFGHEDLVTGQWGMLGNDRYGDCVFAGAAHETMLWNHEAQHGLSFTEEAVLADYSAVTGFDPADPNTDQGTDMQEAASYRRKVGVRDGLGNQHKIAAYLAITPGDLHVLYQAMYLFSAVGIGIQFPSSAFDQFDKGKTWSIVRGSEILGGHYIPLVAKRSHIECVTWGRVQPMTVGFFDKYCDEALAYVSTERLINGVSLEGFDAATLAADLEKLS